MPNWVRPPAPYNPDLPLHVNKQRDRGAVRCSCGAVVELRTPHGYDSDTDCTNCDAVFNLSGQELLPRHMWEENGGGY